jgi:hypothetical protein
VNEPTRIAHVAEQVADRVDGPVLELVRTSANRSAALRVQVDPLRAAVRDDWSVAVSDARQKIALTQLDVLGAAKVQNRSKATALQHAIRAEAIAVACLAASVAVILAGR